MSAKNPHAVALGRLGGLAGKGQPSSPKKAEAARINGRKGGRPKSAIPRCRHCARAVYGRGLCYQHYQQAAPDSPKGKP